LLKEILACETGLVPFTIQLEKAFALFRVIQILQCAPIRWKAFEFLKELFLFLWEQEWTNIHRDQLVQGLAFQLNERLYPIGHGRLSIDEVG
jgi:hypothetical protein